MPQSKTEETLKRFNASNHSWRLCAALWFTSTVTVSLGPNSLQAQSAVGTLTGVTAANSSVSIRNIETNVSRSSTTDGRGRFQFVQVEPGNYEVTSAGQNRRVSVELGTGSSVDFTATQLDAVVVSGVRSKIDFSTNESGTVFKLRDVQDLPVARNATSIALLAPGVVAGAGGFGQTNVRNIRQGVLPSFGGASVAENGYYVNGFDVTNIRTFTSYASIPFDAQRQLQVKTGGYSAEFGRSLGGVVSILTERGTNEWKGGVAFYWDPNVLRGKANNLADPNNPGDYLIYRSANRASTLSMNVYGGGPLIQDKLFIYALVEGRDNKGQSFGRTNSTIATDREPGGLVKLDWNLTSDHSLEWTHVNNRVNNRITSFDNTASKATYLSTHEGTASQDLFKQGGMINILKYTGQITNHFAVSGQFGQLKHLTGSLLGGDAEAAQCPAAYDSRAVATRVDYIGCWDITHLQITDNKVPLNSDTRRGYRFDTDLHLGNHALRAGYDALKFFSTNAGSTYSGGIYYRYFKVPSTRKVNGVVVPAGINEYVRVQDFQTTSGRFEVNNSALYIDDSWEVSKNLKLYGGIRSESFNNFNSDGVSFIKTKGLFAPRFGFSLDALGDQSTKVFGTVGRYYIPVASNTNIRASASESLTRSFYAFNGIDPRTGAPLSLGQALGSTVVVSGSAIPDPRTIADQTLKPMFQDEFIAGFERNLPSTNWKVGLKAQYRTVRNGMDDYCSPYAFVNWAKDNGYNKFDAKTLAPCFVMNPGRGAQVAMNLNNDGQLTNVFIPASYFDLEKYKRTYQGLEFTFEKPKSDGWAFEGSYTLSRLKGNTEGYVNSVLVQEDAGLTQDWDYASFTKGANGLLSNDRTHVLKMRGSYDINASFTITANLSWQSGRPYSCIGFVPETVSDYNQIITPSNAKVGGAVTYSSASSFYCRPADGAASQLIQRGTVGRTPPLTTFDVGARYNPAAIKGLTFQMDIFNVLNLQKTASINEQRDLSRSNDLVNPNYLQPTSLQGARAVRLTTRYEF
jgi:hypothetical protein